MKWLVAPLGVGWYWHRPGMGSLCVVVEVVCHAGMYFMRSDGKEVDLCTVGGKWLPIETPEVPFVSSLSDAVDDALLSESVNGCMRAIRLLAKRLDERLEAIESDLARCHKLEDVT